MINKILYFLGIHNWLYTSPYYDADRYCERCHKYQIASYDMATGETIYD